MTDLREAEFVRRFRSTPSDPGTVCIQLALVGQHGAVSIDYGDWDEGPIGEEERRQDAVFLATVGHPMFPQGRALALHERRGDGPPDEEQCHLLNGPCWTSEYYAAGYDLVKDWIAYDAKDQDWMYAQLLDVYHHHLASDGDGNPV